MGILTKIAEGQYVIKSENINVFPCAYRGVDIDKYSILNTEYNLTHIPSTGLKASYFIKDIPAVYEDIFSIDLCVGGYRFYISGLDEADYKILKNIEEPEKSIRYYNIRTGSGSVTAEAVLTDITSGNTELDKADGNFYGLLLTVNTYKDATAYLDVADKSLIKYSQVESGTPGKSLADVVTIDDNGVKVSDGKNFIGDLTGTANKAKADKNGKEITTTYETKENVSALNTKVDSMAINLNSQEIKLATSTPSICAPATGPEEETAEEKDMFAVICGQGSNTPGWGNLNELSVKHATTADSATNATTAANCTGKAASANKVNHTLTINQEGTAYKFDGSSSKELTITKSRPKDINGSNVGAVRRPVYINENGKPTAGDTIPSAIDINGCFVGTSYNPVYIDSLGSPTQCKLGQNTLFENGEEYEVDITTAGKTIEILKMEYERSYLIYYLIEGDTTLYNGIIRLPEKPAVSAAGRRACSAISPLLTNLIQGVYIGYSKDKTEEAGKIRIYEISKDNYSKAVNGTITKIINLAT